MSKKRRRKVLRGAFCYNGAADKVICRDRTTLKNPSNCQRWLTCHLNQQQQQQTNLQKQLFFCTIIVYSMCNDKDK